MSRCAEALTRPRRRRTAAKSALVRSRRSAGSTETGQAEISARPLRRRAARMARPARVLIRARKPWFLARRRLFGWKVRLLTTVFFRSRCQGIGRAGREAPCEIRQWLVSGRPPHEGVSAAIGSPRSKPWACENGRQAEDQGYGSAGKRVKLMPRTPRTPAQPFTLTRGPTSQEMRHALGAKKLPRGLIMLRVGSRCLTASPDRTAAARGHPHLWTTLWTARVVPEGRGA